METAEKGLIIEEAEDMQGNVVRLLKEVEPPRSNLSSKELTVLQVIYRDDSLMVFKSDKGNVAVILDKVDYLAKMQVILEDSS